MSEGRNVQGGGEYPTLLAASVEPQPLQLAELFIPRAHLTDEKATGACAHSLLAD